MLNFCHFQTHDLIEGDWGGATHNSHLWSWSQPCHSAQPHSWWAEWGLSLDTSHHSAATGMFAGHGDKSCLQKLNGVEAGRIE